MVDKKTASLVVAEFLGTGFLTLVVLSVRGSAIGIPYFVALAAGLVVGVFLLARGNLWGATLNPALTVGLWTLRKISTAMAILSIGFQLLGAWAAYWLFTYFANTKLTSIAGHYSGRIMLAEATGALVLSFIVAAAVYEKFEGAKLAAAGGIAFMIAIFVASGASNGIVNPALALGLRSWSWGTYVLGPVVGSIIGMNLYSLFFTDNGLMMSSAKPSASTTKAASNGKSKKK
jgi:glycerol uptake facilitator-like aquaporin